MANQTVAKQAAKKPQRNAFSDRNWEVLFIIFVLLISVVATGVMVLVSVQQEVFRIIPAAALLAMVELWLLFTVPLYSRLSFWGSLIFIATFLFFAVPAAVLNLLPDIWIVITWLFVVVSGMCFVLMFRQKALFLPLPPVRNHSKKTPEQPYSSKQ
jgi:hypothetical protein